ncbi:expressed unknown protein [Seminavis robusta]|uniref:Uncharacterized protein n=1 Tax=Seminavis robusta TaxID=568900 RepID=A0A9N8EB27_9STRA|nr:expressed unknown protein [Seminavis robusta]|eukprot:Sro865_g212860.1 n/a (224) ;mRNA; f:27704-28569
MKSYLKASGWAVVLAVLANDGVDAFQPMTPASAKQSTALQMGLFDNWSAGGSGNSKDDLDEQWERQQEILRNRRAPKEERDKYFDKVDARRKAATEKQQDMWAWQTKNYAKGEDPIDEWKKRREAGTISDLDDQYGDESKKGGIPLPMASFGVGGEFGVGGKFDNGGRFDLRLPYADQGYVDEDADFMKKIGNIFGGGKKKATETEEPAPVAEEPPKKNNWPW